MDSRSKISVSGEDEKYIQTQRTDAQHLAIITGALITAYFTIVASELRELRENLIWYSLYLTPAVLLCVSLVGYLISGLHTKNPKLQENFTVWKKKNHLCMTVYLVIFVIGIVSMFLIFFCYSLWFPFDTPNSSQLETTCSPLVTSTPCPPTPTSVICPDTVDTPRLTIVPTVYP
jgi:predicted permease